MKRKIIAILPLFIFGMGACDFNTGRNILDKKIESGDPFFSMLYTKSFASRFSLPGNVSEKLPENLKAISVEFNKVNFYYQCNLHLYVSDSLNIYHPVSGDYFYIKPPSEYMFIQDINEADYSWNINRVHLNNMRARQDAKGSAKYKFTSTLSYDRVHRSFLPGLTIVTLNTDCSMFERDRYPADIWIQKKDVGDYLVGNDGPGGVKSKDKNYRFPIPIKLIDQIQPYIEIAVKHNSERL